MSSLPSMSSASSDTPPIFVVCVGMKIAAIEGPIASGKSTILETISRKYSNVVVVHEPVELWEKFQYNGIQWRPLQAFYDNPEGGLFRMQLLVLSSMARQIFKAYEKALKQGANIFICERTLASSVKVFATHFLNSGEMSIEDFTMLQYFADTISLFYSQCFNNFSNIFYLDLSPKQTLQRMHDRGRESEKNVTIEYLTSLAGLYSKWAYDEKFAPLLANDITYLDARHDPELTADAIMKML